VAVSHDTCRWLRAAGSSRLHLNIAQQLHALSVKHQVSKRRQKCALLLSLSYGYATF